MSKGVKNLLWALFLPIASFFSVEKLKNLKQKSTLRYLTITCAFIQILLLSALLTDAITPPRTDVINKITYSKHGPDASEIKVYIASEHIANDLPTEDAFIEKDASVEYTQSPTNTNDQSEKATANQPPAQGPSPAPTNAMSGIIIAEAQNVPYDRSSYQPNWKVGSGCDLRARILQSTSIVEYKTSNGCTVIYGSWKDPYTGQILTGNPYRGDGTTNDLDIDHIIPLKYVNSHGGYQWSNTKKRSYGASLAGQQNGVYVAASASENRRKGDKGPSSYYPPNPEYYCDYAIKWRDLARIYQISLSHADYKVVENALQTCGVTQ